MYLTLGASLLYNDIISLKYINLKEGDMKNAIVNVASTFWPNLAYQSLSQGSTYQLNPTFNGVVGFTINTQFKYSNFISYIL